jgi:hypothetical protein
MGFRQSLLVAIASFSVGLFFSRLLQPDQECHSDVHLLEKIRVLEYAKSRERKPVITGPFPVPFVGWDRQWECMPEAMRYQFSMQGKIGVEWKDPTNEGAPPDVSKNAAIVPIEQSYGFSKTQIPETVWSAMKYRAGRIPGNRFLVARLSLAASLTRIHAPLVWTKDVVDLLVNDVKNGKDVSCEDYPDSAPDIEMALRLQNVEGKSVMIGGSISPWVEAVTLALGAKSIFTSDYNPAETDHPSINTIEVPKLLKQLYENSGSALEAYQHDIVVSYSSVEHDGYGRYGDPFNPTGDFSAMKELYDMTKPGGVLLLAVPSWYQDFIMFSSARVYGPLRLQRLVQQDNWEYLGSIFQSQYHHNVPLSPREDCDMWGRHAVIMLRKVGGAKQDFEHNTCTIECMDKDATDPFVDSPFISHRCKPTKGCKLVPEAEVAEIFSKKPLMQSTPKESARCKGRTDQLAGSNVVLTGEIPALHALCESDKTTYCGSVTPGEHRTHKCMIEKYEQLSKECKDADAYLKQARKRHLRASGKAPVEEAPAANGEHLGCRRFAKLGWCTNAYYHGLCPAACQGR